MTAHTDLGTAARPPTARRAGLGLAVLCLPAILLALDSSVLFFALPQLGTDLGASATQQLWISDVYGFMVAGLLVTMGTLGDRIGRRRLLLFGAAAFAGASLLAAWSPTPETLIAARALLGVAGATVGPSSLALIGSLFPDPARRGSAIAVWFSCFMVGGAIGPVAGGALLEVFWWGSVFLIGVPAMVVLLVAGPVLLPEVSSERASRLDPLSVALSLGAILPVVYGVKTAAHDGWGAGAMLALLVGLLMGAAFVRRQQRLDDPLLDLSLFAHRSLSVTVTVMLLSGIALGGAVLFFSQFMQLVAGLSTLEAGLVMLPATLAMVVSGMLGPVVARGISAGRTVALGMAVGAVGFAAVAAVAGTGSVPALGAFYTLALLGLGLSGGVGVDLILGSAPPEKAGSAAAVSETGQELGLALGIGVLGSLGMAVYTRTIEAGVPGLTGAATDRLSAAITNLPGITDGLPAVAAADVTARATAAFTSGLTTVAGVAALVLLAMSALSAFGLRAPADRDETHRDSQVAVP